MKLDFSKLCAVALVGLTLFGTANAAKVCPGLTGQARTDCLNAEVAKGKRESDAANRKLDRLNKAMKVACFVDEAAPYVATGVTQQATGSPSGGSAYTTGRAIGNKITGQKPCR